MGQIMNNSNKFIEELEIKYQELIELEKIINNQTNENTLEIYKKYNTIKKNLTNFIEYIKIKNEIKDLKVLIKEEKNNIEFKNLALKEIITLIKKKKKILTFLKESNEQNNNDSNKTEKIFLEIRSASGGNEAAIFAEDLSKMYMNFFNNKKIKYEIINFQKGNISGYKEIIIKIIGKNINNIMKNEMGVHRVQRIPITETNDKIQTSTCTVAILQEINNINEIKINPNEIKIDTFRASGAGGQHVNMTDSAVRITHIQTGITVECQNERSQHKNKNTALTVLKTKLIQKKNKEEKKLIDTERKNMIGSGDRTEKIRTYNYTKNRITDHKNNITVYRLKEVMEGQLNIIISKINDNTSNNT